MLRRGRDQIGRLLLLRLLLLLSATAATVARIVRVAIRMSLLLVTGQIELRSRRMQLSSSAASMMRGA